jgi:hypothetical protein
LNILEVLRFMWRQSIAGHRICQESTEAIAPRTSAWHQICITHLSNDGRGLILADDGLQTRTQLRRRRRPA